MAQQQELKYIRHDISSLGTMNADANIASLGKNEFSEVRNYRQSVPGEYEIRTNYKDYDTLNTGTVGATFEILCAGEYRFSDVNGNLTIFDITIYQDGTNIKAIGLNRAAIAASTYWSVQFHKVVLRNTTDAGDLIIKSGVTAIPPPVAGYCLQYGSDFIVTLYGYGVYAIYPMDTRGTPHPERADTWTARLLGKDRAKLPDNVDFAPTQTGDLFLVQYDDAMLGPGDLGNNTYVKHTLTPKSLLPGAQQESIFPAVQYLRIPLNVTYYNSNNAAFDAGTGLRFWQASKNDPAIQNNASRSIFHLQDRAWGYRFVFVHKYIDSRGNHITYRSVASQDIWVPNEVYCPPQVFNKDTQLVHSRRAQFDSTGNPVIQPGNVLGYPVPGNSGNSRFAFSDSYSAQGTATLPYPNAASVRALGESIIGYNAQSWKYDVLYDVNNAPGGTGMDERIWLGAMEWVGFFRSWDKWGNSTPLWIEAVVFAGDYKNPYFTEVTANDLIGAPCTKFTWSLFHAPSDVTEIEIYRTAHVDSTKTVTIDGITQPLYAPHLMGYVGSIKAPSNADDPTFIDNIPDDQIDFSSLASAQDGQFAGDFSGKVLGEYGKQLVLGDIVSAYRVDQPWDDYQVYVYPDSDATININPITALVVQGGANFFEIQYVDIDGTLSHSAQEGAIGGSHDLQIFPGTVNWGHVAIVMPAGYDPAITGIRLLYFDGAVFRLVKTAAPDDGYIIATALECNTGVVVLDAASADVVTKESGVVIWSDPSDVNSWRGLNYLKVHQSAPVTAIIAPLIGELIIMTDRSTVLTNLAGRFEEESPDIGCIGRFCSVKTDKVIFFLSQNGVYFEESSGPVPFPGFVQKLVKKYLTEHITGVPDLANAKRASLGWLAKQREIHLYIPGSDDLGGVLPPVYIIYKFFENVTAEEHKQGGVGMYWARNGSALINYVFTLFSDGNLAYPKGNSPAYGYQAGVQSLYQPLIFTEHSDGKLYACFAVKSAGATQRIHTLDTDNMGDGVDFQGDAYLEFALGLDAPTLAKIIRNVKFYGDFVCAGDVKHGAPRFDGAPSPIGIQSGDGMVGNAAVYPFGAINQKINEPINHRIPTSDMYQSTSYSPIVRIHTYPDGSNNHKVKMSAITVFLKELHNHPS